MTPQFGCAQSSDVRELWIELTRRVPQWFRTCLNVDENDWNCFYEWIVRRRVTWVRSRDVVVFLVPTQKSHIVEAHLALMHRPISDALDDMDELLRWVFALGWRRIEVPVTEIAGRTIRRLLRLMGFQREGTMRCATRGFDATKGVERYLDVDMWAILREGDNHGL